MDERLEILSEESKHMGKVCIHCDKKLLVNDEIVKCPRCHQVHHGRCWMARSGCAKLGCPQIAKTVKDDSPKGDRPVPSVLPKFLLISVAVILVIVLTTVFQPTPPDLADGRTTVVVLVDSFDQQRLQIHVDEFNTDHQEIYIDLLTSSSLGMQQQLLVRMAAGDAPDIFWLPFHSFSSFNELGALLPIDDDSLFYGVHHPSRFKAIGIFAHTVYPEETLEVLHYLVQNLPQADLTTAQQESGVTTPTFLLDSAAFLGN